MSDRPSRRQFMGLTAFGVAGALAGPRMPSSVWRSIFRAPLDADLVVLNAKVYTMDPATPRAEALAVSGGRITAVGTSADIRGLASRRTQTFDARGMTVVPGFIDTHNHAGGTTLL